MGILSRFKKSEPAQPPKSGTIEKEPSYVMLIPKDDSQLNDLEALMNKLMSAPFINVISRKVTDGFELVLEYQGVEYKFCAHVRDFELPPLFRINHDFTDSEIAVMESAKRGLVSEMVFAGDNCTGFHLQIKLLCEMIGEPAGIVDFSGEKMLARRWAKLAAKSLVAPSPEYLYVIQAVSGDADDVWLHTHGLNRCGGVELEILASDKESYVGQGNILNSLAKRTVSNGKSTDEYEPVYAMRLSDGEPLVATWISWEKALKMHPAKIVGGASDREEGHNVNTGVVFVYKEPQDVDNKKLSHVGIFNKLLSENPMMMITTEEMDRMKRLACERIDYLVKMFEMKDSFEKFGALVKIGLEVDEEFRNGDMKEHCWFELRTIDAEAQTLTAELTQEPYYVKALKAGDIRKCRFDEITDWIVFISDDRITPDSVYRLEK